MSSVYVGLDIGGTKLMVAAADAEGVILRTARAATPESLNEGLALLNKLTAEVAGGHTIAGMGAAIGGPLDHRTGTVSPLHQPQWRGVALRSIMEQKWHCPFYVDVDTNIAAMAEWALGYKKARGAMLYITVSTGVGGGLVVDGKLFRGASGSHPEVGHQLIPHRRGATVECECGGRDCLEALVSGTAIRRLYGTPAESLNRGQWEEVGYHLGLGLCNVAAILAPDCIVLGGGVAVGGGEKMLEPARAVMNERLRIVPVPEVRLSTLGYDTALRGTIVAAQRGLW